MIVYKLQVDLQQLIVSNLTSWQVVTFFSLSCSTSILIYSNPLSELVSNKLASLWISEKFWSTEVCTDRYGVNIVNLHDKNMHFTLDCNNVVKATDLKYLEVLLT